MAQVTPAHITYTPTGGAEETLHFHLVIMEEHQASAQVTKFPVQTGYHISNHSIRNNRVVGIEGAITNVRLETSNDADYGGDATSVVLGKLQEMINEGLETTVTTNLGVYHPVVFTKFKTKQEAGKVDSMQFSITGEEVIKLEESGYAAPTSLDFVEVEGAAKDALIDELATYEVYATGCDSISQTTYTVGEDFTITSVDASGKTVKTTYIYVGLDGATGEPIYEIHVDEPAVETTEGTDPIGGDACKEKGFAGSLLGGLKQMAGCLFNEVSDILLEEAESLIDTAMGKLESSLQGFFYDITQGSELGSMLAKAGLGCVVRTATGNTDSPFDFQPGESLPTTNDIMTAAGEGIGLLEPKPEIVTLTQIKCACKEDTSESVDWASIPIPFL